MIQFLLIMNDNKTKTTTNIHFNSGDNYYSQNFETDHTTLEDPGDEERRYPTEADNSSSKKKAKDCRTLLDTTTQTADVLNPKNTTYIDMNNIEEIIKELSIDVFNNLGTGFSETIYHRALEIALRNNNIKYESKRIVPIYYKGVNVGYGETDIIIYVDDTPIVIELKAISSHPREIEISQVKTYMRFIENVKFGIIINFPQPSTKIANNNIDFVIVKNN